MPRIIVITDPLSSEPTDNPAVLLEEHVHSVHLSTDHAASQLVQRLAWAVSDAENAERRTPAHETPSRSPRPAAQHGRQATHARRRQTVAA
jgi:hypothetical protein